MEKKTTGTVITKNFAKKMETISPFELKNKLIEMADESIKKMAHTMLNAGPVRKIRTLRMSPCPIPGRRNCRHPTTGRNSRPLRGFPQRERERSRSQVTERNL